MERIFDKKKAKVSFDYNNFLLLVKCLWNKKKEEKSMSPIMKTFVSMEFLLVPLLFLLANVVKFSPFFLLNLC